MRISRGWFRRCGVVALVVMAACGGDDGETVPDAAPQIDAPPATPAMLALTPVTTDFGTVIIDGTPGRATFTVTNAGEATSGPISASISSSAAANFQIPAAQNTCTTLAGGASCTFVVELAPTGSAGPVTGTLAVTGSPGGTATAMLRGAAAFEDDFLVFTTPSSQLLPSTAVGSTSATTATFTVKHNGGGSTGNLQVTPGGANPTDFAIVTDACSGAPLGPNATCSLVVAFAPFATEGAKSATFTISDPVGSSLTAAVSSTAIAAARLETAMTVVNFGAAAVGPPGPTTTLIVTNPGAVATGPIATTLGGAMPAEFAILADTCNSHSLTPNGTCTLQVRFSPAALGTRAAHVALVAAPGGTLGIDLVGTGASSGISINPTIAGFPSTLIGATSPAETFTIFNTGGLATDPIVVALGGTDPTQFVKVTGGDTCSGQILAAGGSCTVAVQFAPTGTTQGTRTATLVVTPDAAGSFTAALSGPAVTPGALSITPAMRDFGAVGLDTTSGSQTFTVTNTGGTALAIPTVTRTGPNPNDFATAGCTVAIGVGESCVLAVTMTPSAIGARAAAITLTSGTASAMASVAGTGVNAISLVANPAVLNFPGTIVGATSMAQAFVLSNQSSQATGPLTIGATGDFTQTNNCPSTLGGTATCTVVVTFKPTTTGTRFGTVQVAASPGGSISVPAQGAGIARLAITAPATNPFAFADAAVDPDATQTVTLTLKNNDTVGLALDRTLTNVSATASTNDFHLVLDSCTPAVGAAIDLAAGASCNIVVEFDPRTAGAKTGSIKVNVNGSTAASDAATLDLTGTATTSVLAIDDDPQPSPLTATNPTAPTATAAAHDFTAVAVGTSTAVRRFYVANRSGSTTGRIGTQLASSSPGAFQIAANTCAGNALADTAQCFIDVIFAPSTNGAATGTLTVTGTTALGGTATAALAGTGVATPSTITPNPLAFGPVAIGDSTAANTDRAVTITNTTAQVETLNLTVAGTGFSRAAGGCAGTLAANASCIVTVRVAAIAPTGARTGTLTIVESPPGGSITTTVPLTATLTSVLSVAPATTTLANVPVNATAGPILYTVTNSSPAAVSVTGISIAPANAAFSIPANGCGSIAAGGTCTFSVQYAPTTPAAAADFTVTVASAAGPATATIMASAIAIAALAVNADQTGGFGGVIVGADSTARSYTYRNTGPQATTALTASLVGTSPADFLITADTCTGVALAGAATCVVTARFHPTAAGARTALLRVAGTAGGILDVTVRGTGVAAGGMSIAPTVVRFSDTPVGAGTDGPTQDFAVTNTSTTMSRTITVAITDGGLNQYTRVTGFSGDCPATIAASTACTVRLQYRATTAGYRTGQLQITVPAATTASTLAELEGVGLSAAAITSTPSTITFGTVQLGTPTTPQAITLTNSGQVASAISGVVTVGGANAPEFVVGAGCDNVSIPAGGSCAITVAFTATQAGARSATISVPAFTGYVGATVNVTATAAQMPAIGLSPTSPQTFTPAPIGTVVGGQVVQFTVQNSAGTAPTSPISFALSNATDYDFATGGTCGSGTTTLAANASCTIRVRFRPAHVGTLTSTLSITAAQGGGGTVPLSGVGTEALGATTPSSDFGALQAGAAPVQRVFTFSNTSEAATALVATTLTANQDFAIIADTCAGKALAASDGNTTAPEPDACTITVRFVPSGAVTAARTATLDVATTVLGVSTHATTTLTANVIP